MTEIKTRQIRLSKGFTTRQLAELSGISKSQITRIENNQQVPTIDTLCRIAEALGVPVESTYEYHHTENPQSQ